MAAKLAARARGAQAMQLPQGKSAHFEALACLALISAGVVAVGHAGPLSARPLAVFAAWLVAGVAWWRLAWLGSRRSWPARTVRAVVWGGLLLRLLAWSGAPGLTDDGWRYAFEGGLVLEGRSPYASAPARAVLTPPAAHWPELAARINHPEVSAAYPPLTQLVHTAAVAACGGTQSLRGPEGGARAWDLLRAVYGLCDFAVGLVLVAWLRASGRNPAAAWIWAWSPLLALESAGSGHFDALGVLLLCSAMALLERPRAAWLAPALVSAAGLVKLLPLAILPSVLRELRAGSTRVRTWSAIALALFVSAALCVPFAYLEGAGSAELAGLAEYSFRWEGFHLVYRAIERAFAALFDYDASWTDPRRLGRGLCALLWIAAAASCWLARWSARETMLGLLLGFALLVPTLHPWYLAWPLCLAPFLPLRAFQGHSLFALAVLVPLSYQPLVARAREGEWSQAAWVWPSVALPVLLLALWEVGGAWRARSRGA